MQTDTMSKRLLPALPANAPVFEYQGEEYIGRPYDVDMVGKGEIACLITLTADDGDGDGDWPSVLPAVHDGKIKPLTSAARALVEWTKGEL
jgi:hypothetical protein